MPKTVVKKYRVWESESGKIHVCRKESRSHIIEKNEHLYQYIGRPGLAPTEIKKYNYLPAERAFKFKRWLSNWIEYV